MNKINKTLCLLLPIICISLGCLGGGGNNSTSPTTTGTNSGTTGSNSGDSTGTSNSVNITGRWKGTFQETFTDNPTYGRKLVIREISMDITQDRKSVV